MLPRLAGGGLVLGVVEASREGRLLRREDASAFGSVVVTDKVGVRFADLVTILLGLVGSLIRTADEEVLVITVAGSELIELAPNFFGGREGTRAISGTDTPTLGESLGTHSTEGLTPAAVKNWWSFLTTAGG